MSEPTLLPCPFCGGEAMLRAALWPSEGDRDGIIHREATDCPLGPFGDDTFDESIVRRWNERAPMPLSAWAKYRPDDLTDDELAEYVSQSKGILVP